MNTNVIIGVAREADVAGIQQILKANRGEVFSQPRRKLLKNYTDYFVARDAEGRVSGCAAIQYYSGGILEIGPVAVLPKVQGEGIGSALVQECIDTALKKGFRRLWLGTLKPKYFEKFGFKSVSKWSFPVSMLLHKVCHIFQQHPSEWVPALFGRHTFMELPNEGIIS